MKKETKWDRKVCDRLPECDNCKKTISFQEYEKNKGLCNNCVEAIN